MTAIAGIELPDGRVIMGGDSMISDGTTHDLLRDPKVWKLGEALIGCAGDAVQYTRIRYAFVLPALPANDTELSHWVFSSVLPTLQAVAVGDGADKPDPHVLLGVRGRLFGIYLDTGYVCAAQGDCQAIGDGGDGALCALLALRGAVLDPEDRIERALEAASARYSGVSAPFTILTSEPTARARQAAKRRG